MCIGCAVTGNMSYEKTLEKQNNAIDYDNQTYGV